MDDENAVADHDDKSMAMLLQAFEETCVFCRKAKQMFTNARQQGLLGHSSGSIPSLVKAAEALNGVIEIQNFHAMAQIIYDPNYKPVAVAKVKHLLVNTSTQLASLTQKSTEIKHLLSMHNRALAVPG